MRDIVERIEDFEEFAIKTKKFHDARFYRDCIKEINNLRQQIKNNYLVESEKTNES